MESRIGMDGRCVTPWKSTFLFVGINMVMERWWITPIRSKLIIYEERKQERTNERKTTINNNKQQQQQQHDKNNNKNFFFSNKMHQKLKQS